MRAGLDEVGMGPIAGPITAVVVAFPTRYKKIPGVGDSKKLPKKRVYCLAPEIMRQAAYVGIGWAHPSVIDTMGKQEAWRRACLDALEGMPAVDHLWVDGIIPIDGYEGEQNCMPKADDKIWWVGAASIVAKAVRDHDMFEMGRHYQGYGWETNAGYGTAAHIGAVLSKGITPYHRVSFLKKILKRTAGQLVIRLP